jgi:hypothetical protein
MPIEVIVDGNPLLEDVALSHIGCDTVILYESEKNTLYICAHLKDYKPGDPKFIAQMQAIQKIANANTDKTTIVMCDANTQFVIDESNLVAYSKNLSDVPTDGTKKAIFPSELPLSGVVTPIPTSNKVRGPHTAQLDKSLVPVKATIDHVLIYNGEHVSKTDVYVLGDDYKLELVTNSNTMTTSPIGIADHALVVSTTESGLSYGTFNIKGGNPEDAAWAEFIPQKYNALFQSPEVQARLDTHLAASFPGIPLEKVKESGFLSKPRMGIFDINLPNTETLHVTVVSEEVHVTSGATSLVLAKNNDVYESSSEAAEESAWLTVLLDDLNTRSDEKNSKLRDTRREFFLNRGYMLLNYWHIIQNDAIPVKDGVSLSVVYDEWYRNSKTKLPIAQVIKQVKNLYPRLRLISLQELPISTPAASAIIDAIEHETKSKVYTLPPQEGGATRGAIVVFLGRQNGAGRKSRRSVRKKRRNSKRS